MSCICVVSGGGEGGPDRGKGEGGRWKGGTALSPLGIGADACQYGYMVRCIQHEQMLARGVDPSPGPAAAPAAAAPAAAVAVLPPFPLVPEASESEEEDGDGQ